MNIELDEYTKADFEYHTNLGTALDLSRGIELIFNISEMQEKRAVLNFLLKDATTQQEAVIYASKTVQYDIRTS